MEEDNSGKTAAFDEIRLSKASSSATLLVTVGAPFHPAMAFLSLLLIAAKIRFRSVDELRFPVGHFSMSISIVIRITVAVGATDAFAVDRQTQPLAPPLHHVAQMVAGEALETETMMFTHQLVPTSSLAVAIPALPRLRPDENLWEYQREPST